MIGALCQSPLSGYMDNDPNKKKESKWNRANVLMAVGLVILFASWVNSEALGNTFHFEYLVVAAAFCGVSITQWGDKK